MRSQSAHATALHLRLDWYCEPGVPKVWIDRVQIVVVLRNLVANALDAAGAASADPASSVAVHMCRKGAEVVTSVVDTGPGLMPEEVASVFENRQSTKPGGMGVGLGISRSIIEAHGGRTWAEPGPGGKFYFSLPIGGIANE
jgi:two-component system sensor kinase FixL